MDVASLQTASARSIRARKGKTNEISTAVCARAGDDGMRLGAGSEGNSLPEWDRNLPNEELPVRSEDALSRRNDSFGSRGRVEA